jgi:hypothetical protein
MHPSRLARRPLAVAFSVVLALAAPAAFAAPAPTNAPQQGFDLDTGNSAIELVIPTVIPVLLADVAPSDAPIVLRGTTLLTNVFFDALAPYHPTAVGVYSTLPRAPVVARTDRERNIALIYSAQTALDRLFPRETARWAAMVASAGLDPTLRSGNLQTAEGRGRAAANAALNVRDRDGMNALGDGNGRRFNRRPFEDTTGYSPVNTPDNIRDPSRWQPLINTRGNGLFAAQEFVTPQWARTLPYSYRNPQQFRLPPPVDSNPRGAPGRARYKAQLDEVLAASANLTDAQKLSAELFNDKIASLGFVALFLSVSRDWSVEHFVHYDFLVNMAAFDGGIATWQEKARYDAVRPITAARWQYGNQPVRAWAGVGQGTQAIPANQWTSYLNTGDHPDYPSGSACFCSAHAQASREYLGSDQLGWRVDYPAGSSVVEPGITPRVATSLTYPTWTAFETECAQSRVWGGVHFRAATEAPKAMCAAIGSRAHRFLQNLLAGTRELPN